MAHFPHKWATGWNGCNGRTGWMQLPRHKGISLHPLKIFSVLRNGKMHFFLFGATSVAQKRTFLFSDVTDWLRLWKWKSHFFVPHWSRTNENKVLFDFSTCWQTLKEELKCPCICVIASTQSAHDTHSAQSPIYGGSGPWCCSGAAYGRESNLSGTVSAHLWNRRVRGYAAKSVHPVCAAKSAHSHVIRCLIDWLIEYEDVSQSPHFENRYFSETNRPNSANSSLPMGIVIVLRIKQKWRRNLRWYPTKKWKKSTSNVYSINQSSIELHVSAQT